MIENTMLSASSLEDACEKKSPPKVRVFFWGGQKKTGGGHPGWRAGSFFFSESRFRKSW